MPDAFPPNDLEYEEYVARAVSLDAPSQQWTIHLDHGFYITSPRAPGKPQPREGSTVRVYGMLPHYARGAFIDGREAYYSDPDEYEKERQADEAALLEEYEERKPANDERIGKLPEPYAAWLNNLRETEEQATVVDREGAWIFVAEEAHVFATLLKDDASIETVGTLSTRQRIVEVMGFTAEDRGAEAVGMGPRDCPNPTPEQMDQIRASVASMPRLSRDHDDESIRYAIALARAFVTDPESMKDVVPWPAYGIPRGG